MPASGCDPWVREQAKLAAARFERDLAALVAVSSPSGDVEGFEECAAVATALAPDAAAVERPACSSSGHARDLLLRLEGDGQRRLLLLGHLDTVHAHAAHRPLEAGDGVLVGSGAVDMKGGVALALAVLRALAERADTYAEVALLLVSDEEWRAVPFAHTERFAGWDGCLCFEAGETLEGHEAVVVRRKAAGTLRVTAHGRAAHSGSAPDRGANALLALASCARLIADRHDPKGPDRLTAVPTIVRSGEAFNVVPDSGELLCDLRADRLEAIEDVLAGLPAEIDDVRLESEMLRSWPAMDSREATAGLLERASEAAGQPILASGRGGASDASHFASAIELTVDGLGPRGGAAHHRDEYVSTPSVMPRAEVAHALALAALEPAG